MAEAKAVCGSCGAGVTFGAERCPACGERIIWGTAGGAGKACLNCGQLNEPGAVMCSSCGAKLGAAKGQRGGQQRKQQPVREARTKRPIEPWQIIAVVAVLALVGVLAYVELSRDHAPAAAPMQSGAPMTMPPMMQQQQPAVDIAALDAAVRANPTDAKAVLALANGLHDNGEWLRAVENYTKYLKTHPKDPDARVDMGVCYYQLGMQDTVNTARYFALAITEMEAALRGTPTHQPAAFNLGVVNLQKGDLDISNRWFRKAVELGPATDLGTRAQRMLQQHSSIP
jgi:Tfp pilus assembly protein PilF/RNA polymerase subunit RPABC4/transcription elongation factor Spt4